SDIIIVISVTVRSAPGRSALLTAKTSPISIMPALIAWMSSPIPGTSTTTFVCTVRMISTSSCPTPTVSTSTLSNPAASRRSTTSFVARVAGGRIDVGEQPLRAAVIALDQRHRLRQRAVLAAAKSAGEVIDEGVGSRESGVGAIRHSLLLLRHPTPDTRLPIHQFPSV